MPGWLNVILGILAGLAVIGGALALAVRPYRDGRQPTTWLPDARESRSGGDCSSGSDTPFDGG